MTVDIFKAIFELERLIEVTPLSEAERNKHKTNIQAMRQVATEWQQMKNDGEVD